MKDVVKNVAASTDRNRNLIIFGLDEESRENVEEKVSDVLQSIDHKPHFVAVRFGNNEEKRPIRVKFDRPETAREVLKSAKNLKLSRKYKQVYLSPDMTPEQRADQKILVDELKEKIKNNPEQRFFIKGGKVCKAETPDTTVSVSLAVEHERVLYLKSVENMVANLACKKEKYITENDFD